MSMFYESPTNEFVAGCGGPYDYGDTVLAPDGRYGEIHGWGQPPLEYKVAFAFDIKSRLSSDVEYYSPVELRFIKRAVVTR